ncbi:MAG: restriction endonuclease subunit M [Methanomassiliicoccales archaeon]
MTLTQDDYDWYYDQIEKIDPHHHVVTVLKADHIIEYNQKIKSDENHKRSINPEEVVRALTLCILASSDYGYDINSFYIEKRIRHGHPSSKSDEIDLIIYDGEGLAFSMWEFKSSDIYNTNSDSYIQYQLFGTAPLLGAPKLLCYATIKPGTKKPVLTILCVDRTKYPSYESWKEKGSNSANNFPISYKDPKYIPLARGRPIDLRLDCSTSDFRDVAATFHAEFFGEHPDNVTFANLLKCLLAKIYDEKQTRNGDNYNFQVLYKSGIEESAKDVFERINQLYLTAYKRYIEPNALEPDEINPKEFSPERVKMVVKVLQNMSITQGSALNGDIIGTFFEEILRTGFKQDKGMYFTHTNLVYFILEAMNIEELTINIWKNATHPDNRLPYIIDPSCGSGAFLLKSMEMVTDTIKNNKTELVSDQESIEFYNARLSDAKPNYWAENFIYGMDPKFIMAIIAKINMVLHGDGSAHTFKYDALKPFSSYSDDKLKIINDPQRVIEKNRYPFEVVESFDVVVSNPPFGITIASETKATLSKSHYLRNTLPSECLFLERWFQLLKPKGRLGVVVPESLLNAADYVDARLFLYRTFWIKSIVSLPRNLFIDTPTLVSLLFAQKKTKGEIKKWDDAWEKAEKECCSKLNDAMVYLKKKNSKSLTPAEIEKTVLKKLSPIVTSDTFILKGGSLTPISTTLPSDITTGKEACNYYFGIIKLSGFNNQLRNYVFNEVCKIIDYEYPVYSVDEVGYKLSKRKERIRPNQLCKFIGATSSNETPNLHLTDEIVELKINIQQPDRVIDYIRRDVKWT